MSDLELTPEEQEAVNIAVAKIKEWAQSSEGKAAILAASERSKSASAKRRKATRFRCCSRGCCMCRRY